MSHGVFFHTLGCKLNQAETSGLAAQFRERGYRVVPRIQDADVILINTCTVTGRSDSKCRQAVRQAAYANPQATLIVSGCYAQSASSEIAALSGVDYVFGTEERFHLFDYFSRPGKKCPPVIRAGSLQGVKAESASPGFTRQTRAFLKIQDGCDRFCTYCIVPHVRGRSRSVPEETVLLQAGSLIERGFPEIVLTGVHIGDYGKEKSGRSGLPGLLRKLAGLQGLGRLRLSSLDPEDVGAELIETVKDSEKICRHFHIPVQSGCDTVLKRMGRRVGTGRYRKMAESLTAAFGVVGLGTDIIVGFPGESPRDFEDTVLFLGSLPFSYFHVFPFSKRPGTEAYHFEDTVSASEMTERAARLRALGGVKKDAFQRAWLGKTVDVLIEGKKKGDSLEGFSSEYLRVSVPYEAGVRNRIVPVRVVQVDERVYGEIVK